MAARKTESAEHRSFRRYYADMLDSIDDPTSLAARLYSVDLLSRETRKNISDLTEIGQDTDNFYEFLEALEHISMHDLCGKLRSKCDIPIPVDPNVAKASLRVRVEMEITNVGTQGYPGVGKTSVLDLAMGKEPAPTRTSTDCVDPPSRYLMIDRTKEGVEEWENVTTDKMFELVCEAVNEAIQEISIDSDSDTEDEQLHPQASNSTPSFDKPASTVFPELLKELSSSKSSGVIFNSHWMMVTDCGGQPPFLDAAALFLRNSCLQIFPVKLNEPLSKRPEYSYFYKGVRASFDEDCVPLTHKQIIETLAKSVASIQPPYTPSATKCPKGAKFTIVGTFEDEAHKCSETVEEKESILKEVLKPYKRFQVQLCKKVILPVNATVGKKVIPSIDDAAIDTEAINAETKKKRAELARKLRRLFKKSNVSMKVDMKLRWFGLLLNILTIAEKEHKAVLALEECYKLGESLGMDKSETKEAIQFFHDISLIMHFDTPKLRDSVIIDTKPVLNKLSRIISVSFLDEDFLADHYKIELPHGAKDLLQEDGRFSKDTLKKCVEFTEHITLQFFLDILEHVKIAVAIDDESMYFMPCALSYDPEASVSESSPPWVIRLRRKDEDIYIPIPVGYLPAVVVFLLTEFSSHFSTNRCQRQYRNKIKLRYKRGGFVYLIERHLQLEIYFSCFGQLPQDCATIRDLVLEAIRLTEEKLHFIQEGEGAITKVDSFLCSCGKGSAQHTCAYNPLSRILECTESEVTGECCKLNHQHLLWLDSSSTPQDTQQPDSHSVPADADAILLKLRKHTFPEYKWTDLATGLMLASRVPEIESEKISNLSRLIALVNHWTANSDEGSRWKTLVDAVNIHCREYIVARNLAQDVCVPCPPCPE